MGDADRRSASHCAHCLEYSHQKLCSQYSLRSTPSCCRLGLRWLWHPMQILPRHSYAVAFLLAYSWPCLRTCSLQLQRRAWQTAMTSGSKWFSCSQKLQQVRTSSHAPISLGLRRQQTLPSPDITHTIHICSLAQQMRWAWSWPATAACAACGEVINSSTLLST